MKRCHSCRRQWVSEKRQPAVKEVCEGCGAYLHCCLNCKFYDEHAHNKCKIPTTDWVGDRAGCNFCDEFTFADSEAAGKDDKKKGRARDALAGLFDDDTEKQDDNKNKRDDFNKLFGD